MKWSDLARNSEDKIMRSHKTLPRNPFYKTMCGVIKGWATQDVVQFSRTVDLTTIEHMRESARANGLCRPTYTALIIKAISLALRDHPKVNRLAFDHLFLKRLVQLNEVHAAVAVECGLDDYDIAVPTILRDTDQKSSGEITGALAKSARAGSSGDQTRKKFLFMLRHLPARLNHTLISLPGLAPSLWTKHHGGSFLLTSPAKYGVETIFVKTSWPLTFSFGLVEEKALVVNGKVEARRATVLTLSWHRRLTTGAVIAHFFNEIVRRLAEGDLEDKAHNSKIDSGHVMNVAPTPQAVLG